MRPLAALLVTVLLVPAACRPRGCSGEQPAPAAPPIRDTGPEDADLLLLPPPPPPPPPRHAELGPPELREDFSSGKLDPKVWVPFVIHDVKQAVSQVSDRGTPERPDLRLALGADTIGTDDRTVKTVGVRTKRSFDFRAGKRFGVDIDWNSPANGSYLSAAIYLCPTVAAGNPEDEPDWLKFEYVGVPRDNTVRLVIAYKAHGHRRWLDREGWPKVRAGKVVRENRIEIVLDAADLVVFEAGKERFRKHEHSLSFTEAVVYLRVSTHSNYFLREILFDDVEVAVAEVPR